jgi:hypothetical protein
MFTPVCDVPVSTEDFVENIQDSSLEVYTWS